MSCSMRARSLTEACLTLTWHMTPQLRWWTLVLCQRCLQLSVTKAQRVTCGEVEIGSIDLSMTWAERSPSRMSFTRFGEGVESRLCSHTLRLREETPAPRAPQPGDQQAAFIRPRNAWLPEHLMKLATCKRAKLSLNPDTNNVTKSMKWVYRCVLLALKSSRSYLIADFSAKKQE